MLLVIPLMAQISANLKDSLLQQLAITTNNQQRVFILQNLVDISMLENRDTLDKYKVRLLEEGIHTNNQAVILEACKELGNSSKLLLALRARQELSKLPPSREKEGAMIFLRWKIFNAGMHSMNYNDHLNLRRKTLKYLTNPPKNTNIFEKYFNLNIISRLLLNNENSSMMELYCKEMLELTQKMGKENQFLENMALIRIADIYNKNGKERECIETNKKLLRNIESLETHYRKKGRIYRDYEFSKYSTYKQILYCRNKLTPNEEKEYYLKIEKTEKYNPYLKQRGNTDCKLILYKLLHKQEYDKIENYFDSLTKNKSRIRINNVSSFSVDTIKDVGILNGLIETYAHIGNKTKLIQILKQKINLNKETIEIQNSISLQELGLYFDVATWQDTNRKMEIENAIAKEKANNAQRILAKEEAKQRLEKAQQDRKKNQILLNNSILKEQRNQVLLKKNEIEKEKSEQKKQSLFLAFFLLLALFIVSLTLLLNARRLNKKLKSTQKTLEKARDEAEASDRAKTQFIQNMSHEIRTPLNAIVGFSSCICNDIQEEDEETKMFSNLIATNSDLLLALVNDILDMSLLESGLYKTKMSEIKPREVCCEVQESIKQRIPSGVQLLFECNLQEAYHLTTDHIRLQQLLINLLTNAIKYTEKGSIILSCNLSQDEQKIIFSVTDTGKGVPADKAEAVFERFEKLNSSKQGTGLGLHICKLIVGSLGGKIWLDTSYQNGAKFVFTLPVKTKI